MNTFSDLMNLLLCFFVLLFSMSTVDAEKWEKVVASLQSTFSVLPSGGSSIGDGQLIASGISQLDQFDSYYEAIASEVSEKAEEVQEEQDVVEEYEQQALEESEQMAEQIEEQIAQYGLQDLVDVQFNADYVIIDMNGALLFDSGQIELRSEAYQVIDKLGRVIEPYQANVIEVEGHTDNVPIRSAKFESNNVLSMYRALTVADYLREITTIEPGHIKSSGRGDYAPVADNSTPEGRARNRRVEIKIYNSYNSDFG